MSAAAASFLGDSTTDIQTAYAAGVMSIGYANKKPRNSSPQAQAQ